MKKPGRPLVLSVLVPFLAGCFTVARVPVPPTAPEREATDVKGVVVRDGSSEEEVRFSTVHDVEWTPNSLSIVGDVKTDAGLQTVTRNVPLTDLSALLVRQLDPGKTSAIVGGVIIGATAVIAFLVTGHLDQYGR